MWEYVNPFFGKPLFGGREGSQSNQVFRAYRYSAEDIALARNTMAPQADGFLPTHVAASGS